MKDVYDMRPLIRDEQTLEFQAWLITVREIEFEIFLEYERTIGINFNLLCLISMFYPFHDITYA